MKDTDGKDGRDTGRSGQDRGDEAKRIPVRELARKLFSTGAEAVQLTEEGLRSLVGDVNAKETVKDLLDSVTRGTDTIQNLMVREARHYLDTINFRDELGKVLSNYSIEINAKVNFVPREKSPEKKKGRGASRDSDAARIESEKFKVKFVAKEEENGDSDGNGDDKK